MGAVHKNNQIASLKNKRPLPLAPHVLNEVSHLSCVQWLHHQGFLQTPIPCQPMLPHVCYAICMQIRSDCRMAGCGTTPLQRFPAQPLATTSAQSVVPITTSIRRSALSQCTMSQHDHVLVFHKYICLCSTGCSDHIPRVSTCQ